MTERIVPGGTNEMPAKEQFMETVGIEPTQGSRRCFYCTRKVRNPELDHSPLPSRHGGTEVVPACAHCHNLKDRLSFLSWTPAELDAAARGATIRSSLVLSYCLAAIRGEDNIVDAESVAQVASECTTAEARIALFKCFNAALDATHGAVLDAMGAAA